MGYQHETTATAAMGASSRDGLTLHVNGAFLQPSLPAFASIDGLCRATVHLKLEGLNAAGSIKLKTALQLIEELEATDRLRADTQIVELSSGNLGVALALICANRGYRFTCVTDPNTSRQATRAMQAAGARIVRVDGNQIILKNVNADILLGETYKAFFWEKIKNKTIG